MRQYKIGFCEFPGHWEVNKECSRWIAHTKHEMKMDPRIVSPGGIWESNPTDTPITMLRNRAAKLGKTYECDYILMIDDDIEPDALVGIDPAAKPFWAGAWEFMMNRRDREEAVRKELAEKEYSQVDLEQTVFEEIPPCAVAAPYCGGPPQENVFVFRWKDWESDSADPNFRLEMIEREEAVRFCGFQPVPAIGTGLILYDIRIFDRLDKPWFDYEYEDAPYNTMKSTTEDVYQTRNATLLGMPTFCYWDSWAAHYKTKRVCKPRPLTSDNVLDSLADAVKRGHSSRKKVYHVSRDGNPMKGITKAPDCKGGAIEVDTIAQPPSE